MEEARNRDRVREALPGARITSCRCLSERGRPVVCQHLRGWVSKGIRCRQFWYAWFAWAKVFALTLTGTDMINMLKLGFVPHACCWVHRRGQAQGLLAV